MSEQNLNRFLEDGKIWFSRADIFGDKMECVRIKDIAKARHDFKTIEARKRKFLISCWHLADRESLVLWDTHSKLAEDRRTVAIRFDSHDLITMIKDAAIKNHNNLFYKTEFTHGRAVYRELIGADLKLLMDMAVKEPSFRKEEAFRYENEYRFVIKLASEHSTNGYSYSLNTAVGQQPFKIIVNPLLESNDYLPLKHRIEKTQFADKLIQSDLAGWLHPELW